LLKYVRDQLLMLPHTHVNWRPYESVRHLLPTLVDNCVDLYTCWFSLIYFSIVEWYYLEQVRQQFGLVQSVPPPLSELFYHIYTVKYKFSAYVDRWDEPSLHPFVEEHQKLSALGFKKKNTNWKQYHQTYVDRWDELPLRDSDEEEWNVEDYGRY
jgi:hypothetical protein